MEENKPTNEDIGAMFLGEEPETEEVVEEVQEEAEEEVEEVEEVAAEDDSEDSDTTEDPEPVESNDDLVEVEYEGQLIEAPKAIADALMRQADYTQKTQEVATQRKEVETALGLVEQQKLQYEFAQSVQPKVLEAQQLESQADQYRKYLKTAIDSGELDALQMQRVQMEISELESNRDKIVAEINNQTDEFQQAQEQSRQELLNKGTEVLKQTIPGWGEEAQKQLRDYALGSGFTEQEVNSLIDPRQVTTLWKASQYDVLQSGKSAAVKKVQDAPTIKPKARDPMPQETKDKLNLRKKLQSNKISSRDKQKLVAEDLAKRWG